jgi:alcohol dehydrogenase (cytochrome c)
VGESWKYGGAKPWLSGSYDPALGLAYWGIGDPNPMIYGASREGITVLCKHRGARRRYRPSCDGTSRRCLTTRGTYDSSWEAVLLDREIRGETASLLVHFGKGGYTYLLDRETGEFHWSVSVTRVSSIGSKDRSTWRINRRRDPVAGKDFVVVPGNLAVKAGIRRPTRRALG